MMQAHRVREGSEPRVYPLVNRDRTWLPSAVRSRPFAERRSPVMRAEITPLLNGSLDCNPEKAPQPIRSQQVGECCCTPVAALGFMCSRASDEKCGRGRWAEDSAFSSARWNQIFSFPASVCHLWGSVLTSWKLRMTKAISLCYSVSLISVLQNWLFL